MRVWLTGGSGFVGSHLVRAFGRGQSPSYDVLAPSHAEVDVTDAAAVRRSVAEYRPDAIVHAAILNDFDRLEREGWDAYVGATHNVVDAANAVGAHVVLVSTDWVFDGTQGGATEATPTNPINRYGFLKAASELVVTERADRGAVARIAAVQGVQGATRRAARTPGSAISSPRSCARCAPASASPCGRARRSTWSRRRRSRAMPPS